MKFRKDLPEAGESKSYIRLKDKESVTGIFRGEPYEFNAIWENKKAVEVPEGTPNARFRFKINLVVKEGSVYVAKIFENTQTFYKQLAELSEEWDLENTVVKISRSGNSISDTTYSIIPTPNPLTQETKNHLATVKLNPLGKKVSEPSAPTPDYDPSFSNDDEIPF